MFSLASAEVHLEKFHEPGIFNYSVLLLSEDKTTLYVGAREAVFALSAHNISVKQHEVRRGLPLDCRVGRRPSRRSLLQSALVTTPPGASGAFLAPWPAPPPSCTPGQQPPAHQQARGPSPRSRLPTLLPSSSVLPRWPLTQGPLSFPLEFFIFSLWRISSTHKSREWCRGGLCPRWLLQPRVTLLRPCPGAPLSLAASKQVPNTLFICEGFPGCPLPQGKDSFVSE